MSALFCYNYMPSRREPQTSLALTVEDTCRAARTGDILLFSGVSFTSWAIEWISASQYSHLAMVVENQADPANPFLLESVDHAGTQPDVIDKYPRAGVRLMDLRTSLNSYKGNAIALRTLCTDESQVSRLRDHMNTVVRILFPSLHRKPYEHHWLEFVVARTRWCSSLYKETPEAFYCSELVAHLYGAAGLLDPLLCSPSLYLPDNFCATSDIELCTPKGFVKRCWLSKEFQLVIPLAKPAIHDRIFRAQDVAHLENNILARMPQQTSHNRGQQTMLLTSPLHSEARGAPSAESGRSFSRTSVSQQKRAIPVQGRRPQPSAKPRLPGMSSVSSRNLTLSPPPLFHASSLTPMQQIFQKKILKRESNGSC